MIFWEIGDLGSSIVVESCSIFSRVDGSLGDDRAIDIFDAIFDENIAPIPSTIADCDDSFWLECISCYVCSHHDISSLDDNTVDIIEANCIDIECSSSESIVSDISEFFGVRERCIDYCCPSISREESDVLSYLREEWCQLDTIIGIPDSIVHTPGIAPSGTPDHLDLVGELRSPSIEVYIAQSITPCRTCEAHRTIGYICHTTIATVTETAERDPTSIVTPCIPRECPRCETIDIGRENSSDRIVSDTELYPSNRFRENPTRK